MRIYVKPVLLTLLTPCLWSQAVTRVAIVPGDQGQNQSYKEPMTRVTNTLLSDMIGKPGIKIEIGDEAIQKMVETRADKTNGVRFDPATAVEIGKRAGYSDLIIINIDSYTSAQGPTRSGSTTTVNGTVVLRAAAQLVSLKTGDIIARPISTSEGSKEISRSSPKTCSPIKFGPFAPPCKEASSTSNGDPKVIMEGLLTNAVDAVSSDLAAKLTDAIKGTSAVPSRELPGSPGTSMLAGQTILVAGIANGNIYITAGSSSGVKPGQKFQIVRMVDTGLTNGDKPIRERQSVCTFVVVNIVDESDASGRCDGTSVPKKDDIAVPIP